MSNWKKIWNNMKINEENVYEFNGYKFKNNEEYYKFIFELTKNIVIKENQKILDIGCGNGSFINEVLKKKMY